jgi:hypothetical protein
MSPFGGVSIKFCSVVQFIWKLFKNKKKKREYDESLFLLSNTLEEDILSVLFATRNKKNRMQTRAIKERTTTSLTNIPVWLE